MCHLMTGLTTSLKCGVLTVTENHTSRRYFLISIQSNMAITALKLNEMEQNLTGNTQLRRILFDCYWLVSWATIIVTQLHVQVIPAPVRSSSRGGSSVISYYYSDVEVSAKRRVNETD